MNAEALTHAAKACRESSDVLLKAADDADVFLHRCPDAGTGMRRVSDEMRARAIGLKVASAFLARCSRAPQVLEVLGAVEAGADVYAVMPADPVVVRDEEDPAQRPTLAQRIRALIGRPSSARAA